MLFLRVISSDPGGTPGEFGPVLTCADYCFQANTTPALTQNLRPEYVLLEKIGQNQELRRVARLVNLLDLLMLIHVN